MSAVPVTLSTQVAADAAGLPADVVAEAVGAGVPVAVSPGTIAGVLTAGAGQSAENLTLAGSVTAAIVTFPACPTGSRIPIR
jgi:hypothetical protein